MKTNRTTIFLTSLIVLGALSTGCASFTRPEAPTLLSPPSYSPSNSPIAPRSPQSPSEPTYELPSSSDVNWRDTWADPFTNDGENSKSFLNGEAIGFVFPVAVDNQLRTALISAALANNALAFDLGQITTSGLQFKEKSDDDNIDIHLTDPTAIWVASSVATGLGLERVFRIQTLEVYSTTIDVIKFDITPSLKKLEGYNASIPGYNARISAYEQAFKEYLYYFRVYGKEFSRWKEKEEKLIEARRALYEQPNNQALDEFNQNWSKYIANLPPVKRDPPVKPTVEVPSYEVPPLDQQESVYIPDKLQRLEVLSMDQIHEILLDIAAESVPCQVVHVIGQVVERTTGQTLCTVDSTLMVPSENSISRARLVRALVERILQ